MSCAAGIREACASVNLRVQSNGYEDLHFAIVAYENGAIIKMDSKR